nr:Chain B, Cystic fibrosis transmembrane conductance regulator [Homo sapiens]
EEVQDTRL